MGGEGMIRCRKTTGRAPPPLLILTFMKTWPFSPRGFTKQEVKCREGNWQGEKTSSKLFSCETRLRMIPPPPLPHTSQSGPRVGISPQTATNHLSWKILWSLARGKPRRLFPAERSREGGGHRGPNPALGRWPLPRSQAAALVAGGGSAGTQERSGGKAGRGRFVRTRGSRPHPLRQTPDAMPPAGRSGETPMLARRVAPASARPSGSPPPTARRSPAFRPLSRGNSAACRGLAPARPRR